MSRGVPTYDWKSLTNDALVRLRFAMSRVRSSARHHRRAQAATVVAFFLMTTTGAMAHHSYAMFDVTREVKLKGTVKTFFWTNPHSAIEIEISRPDGRTDTWGVECNSPNNLVRMGWKSTSLKPGDKVTIGIHPLRGGEHGGSFLYIIYADGHTLGEVPGSTNGHPHGAPP
jgi:hypothetical protein